MGCLSGRKSWRIVVSLTELGVLSDEFAASQLEAGPFVNVERDAVDLDVFELAAETTDFHILKYVYNA
jgi:hypothetical protein